MKEVVSLSELEKIARLSKLEFSAEELQSFLRDINDIVAHFEKLNQSRPTGCFSYFSSGG